MKQFALLLLMYLSINGQNAGNHNISLDFGYVRNGFLGNLTYSTKLSDKNLFLTSAFGARLNEAAVYLKRPDAHYKVLESRIWFGLGLEYIFPVFNQYFFINTQMIYSFGSFSGVRFSPKSQFIPDIKIGYIVPSDSCFNLRFYINYAKIMNMSYTKYFFGFTIPLGDR